MEREQMDARLAQDIAETMTSRKNVYELLARCFEREIDQAFADRVAASFAFESEDANLVQGVQALKSYLGGIDEQGIEQLAVWFDRIFFGMGPLSASHAFPYESVYTSQRGLLMQEAYAATRRAYREQGMRKSDTFAEPDDHIAVQLSFMAALCTRALEALEDCNEELVVAACKVQRDFLNTHILNWIDRFAADVRAAAKGQEGLAGGFYANVAQLAACFAVLDAALLDEMLA